MKNKTLNLMALVAMAFCFATFTFAKTNLPATAEKVGIVQTEDAPTVTSTQTGTNLNDIIGVNVDSQNSFSVADGAANDTYDAILTNNYFDGGTSIEITEPVSIQRLNTKPDSFYLSATRLASWRPPSGVNDRQTISYRPRERILKRPFDTVSNFRHRR